MQAAQMPLVVIGTDPAEPIIITTAIPRTSTQTAFVPIITTIKLVHPLVHLLALPRLVRQSNLYLLHTLMQMAITAMKRKPILKQSGTLIIAASNGVLSILLPATTQTAHTPKAMMKDTIKAVLKVNRSDMTKDIKQDMMKDTIMAMTKDIIEMFLA